ncbi:hypothetical protein [Streptomyces sp. NRRL S-337]|uniref:hypothetical protein n=1 Tax=Streptomyces sp. NRRL S-337 TaxID=1463900 RepID=UPI0007C55EE1|nr:hypothetical protein [Streptomyces sp. NRRL S-337]
MADGVATALRGSVTAGAATAVSCTPVPNAVGGLSRSPRKTTAMAAADTGSISEITEAVVALTAARPAKFST